MGDKRQKTKRDAEQEAEGKPVGYRVQRGIPCCANCRFGGYMGNVDDDGKKGWARVCVCEIMGEDDADLNWTEPLGICKAYKA